MSMLQSAIRTTLLSGFDDPVCSSQAWGELLRRSDTDAVNLTWHWQRCWWDSFGRGRLLLIAAHRYDELVSIAPLFADQGMVFNICPEDHLDFVGDVSDPLVLDAILNKASECVESILGIRFYFIPNTSRTGKRLEQAAKRLGWDCFQEAQLPSPWIDIEGRTEHTDRCTRKKSLLRHERYFTRTGELVVDTLTTAADVVPHLDVFFDQHIRRRATTPQPSLFLAPHQREYYRRLTEVAAAEGWLRFTRIGWEGRAIAYHFGLSYRGRYLWGIPTFDIDLAQHSPGEVLLRHVLLQAIAEQARQFDFGPGDETYKQRFATNVTHLETWGLYPAIDSERIV